MTRTMLVGALLLLVVSACGDGGRIDELTGELDSVRADLAAAEDERDAATSDIKQLGAVQADLDGAREEVEATVAERDDALAQLEHATAAIAELEDRVEMAEEAVSTAESAAQDEITRAQDGITQAQEEIDELRAAFDEDLAAARTELTESLESTLCEMAADDPGTDIDVAASITRLIDADPRYVKAFEGFDMDAAFDHTGLAAAAEACGSEAALTADKGSGFYTVGDEIEPGRWRSTGTSDDCYWARLDEEQDILGNHFGDAGGSVTIQSSDYEVQFSDCGTWEYLGP